MSIKVWEKKGLRWGWMPLVIGVVAALAGTARTSVAGFLGDGEEKPAGPELATVRIPAGAVGWENRENYK